MTALAGRWNFDGNPDADRACAGMLAALSVYGPHDVAQWDMGSISLGRRLYRTLPEDIHDQGPITGAGGRVVLVADIRLDNRDELIAELGIAPDRARAMADSAILLAAWERWEDACFDHLVGDYAFALFDIARRRLILARDPLGMRPLHYHRGRNFIAFATMGKGLHTLPEIPRWPDEIKIAEHLALLPEGGPQSFFKGIDRVEAGCLVIVTDGAIAIRRHWDPKPKPLTLAGPEAYAEGLRHYFDQGVRARLRGAGPKIGAHLSSGFDSSSVAASAALQMGQDGKVFAFTSVPREGYAGKAPRLRLGDEGPIAALTAARYPNMEHVLIRTTGRSPLDGLDRYFYLYERPMLNLCNAQWIDAINDAARDRGLKVMLAGQMGNMTISYDGLTLLPQLIRDGRWLHWLREGTGLVRNGHMRIRNVMAQSFGPYMPLPLWIWINKTFRGVTSGATSYSAIHPDRLEALDIPARARERNLDLHYRPRTDGFESRLWVFRRIDMGPYTKGTLAGWGIDQRDPTADRRLIEFSLNVPEEQYLRDGQTKALARRAFASRLPQEVIDMRGKGYQAVDWHENLTAARGAVAEELSRLDDCAPAVDALDIARMKALIERMPDGGWEKESVMRSYRLALLRGVSTGHFLRRATGSNA